MRIADTPKERVYFLIARYFQFWAHFSLKRWRPQIIAITGSTGKTTMLHLLEAQLGDVAHFSHNANSIYGVSFDILGMSGVSGSRSQWLRQFVLAPLRAFTFTRSDKLYIVEIDGARPQGASLLAKWLQPDLTAWINVEQSHAEFFDGQVEAGHFATHLEAIVDEFMSLPRNTKKLIVIDKSDAAVEQAIDTERAALTAAVDSVDSKTFVQHYVVTLGGTTFATKHGTYTFSCLLPREVASQLAMVEKIMAFLGREICYDLSELTLPPGRSTVLAGRGDTTIIDSTYNAQLASVLSTLDMVSALEAASKWVVLGDIIELGSSEAEQHRKLAAYLKQSSFDKIILVGRRLKAHALPLLADMPNVVMCNNSHEVLQYLKDATNGQEVLLFKGSQQLEWVVEHMLADPTDISRLARQSPADRARRKRLGYA